MVSPVFDQWSNYVRWGRVCGCRTGWESWFVFLSVVWKHSHLHCLLPVTQSVLKSVLLDDSGSEWFKKSNRRPFVGGMWLTWENGLGFRGFLGGEPNWQPLNSVCPQREGLTITSPVKLVNNTFLTRLLLHMEKQQFQSWYMVLVQ